MARIPTADGHIALVGVPDELMAAFWNVIERPELAEVERFNGPLVDGAKEELFELLGEVFEQQPTAFWERRLRAAEIRLGAIL